MQSAGRTNDGGIITVCGRFYSVDFRRFGMTAQLKRYRYDAGLKGDEAGAVIGKKATTVYKYEAGTLWVSPGDLRALLNEYGVNMVTAFTEIGDPRAGGRKKDESALRWRKMRTYYDMMNPAKQRTLLDVARAMAEDF